MIYVLIVLVFEQAAGGAISMQEFGSKAACERAAQYVTTTWDKMLYTTATARVQCLPKGEAAE